MLARQIGVEIRRVGAALLFVPVISIAGPIAATAALLTPRSMLKGFSPPRPASSCLRMQEPACG